MQRRTLVQGVANTPERYDLRAAYPRKWKDVLGYGVVQCISRPPLSWLLFAPVALYHRLYYRLFPQRYEARSFRNETRLKAFSARIEQSDPEFFERVTGRRARLSSQIPPPPDD